MTPRSDLISPELTDYSEAHSTPADPLRLEQLAASEALVPGSPYPISPVQGSLLAMLVRLLGVRRAIEIGTFTGASSLAVAQTLPADGHLLCLDVNAEWTALAREFWIRAGVADRVELRLGPALDSLRALPADPDSTFDFAFVDADKQGYPAYVDELAPRMRPGGLVLVDNTLRHGRILPGTDEDEDDRSMRAFNDGLLDDSRWETVLLPVFDGLTFLARR